MRIFFFIGFQTLSLSKAEFKNLYGLTYNFSLNYIYIYSLIILFYKLIFIKYLNYIFRNRIYMYKFYKYYY